MKYTRLSEKPCAEDTPFVQQISHWICILLTEAHSIADKNQLRFSDNTQQTKALDNMGHNQLPHANRCEA